MGSKILTMKLTKLFSILTLIFLTFGTLYSNAQSPNIKELEKLAKKDPAYMIKLGDMYAEGNGVAKNEKKALDYYKKAAKKDNLEGVFKLGNAYYYGIGTKEKKSKGWDLLEKAADKGYMPAEKKVAQIFYANDGYIYQNYEKAVRYFEKAANNGDMESQKKVGNFYLYGDHVAKDYEKAFHYIEMAAKQGDPVAQYELAGMYYYGNGINKNLNEATKYYQMSADQGYAPAINKLGDLYVDGEGVPENIEKAIEYFRLAASLNDINALVNLGNLYYSGKGVNENDQEAAKYYLKAIEAGKVKYDDQLKNLKNEIANLERNYPSSKNRPGITARELKVLDDDIQVRKNLLEKLTNEITRPRGYGEAYNNMAELYRDGEGVEKNEEEARKLFKLASDLGYAEAQYTMGLIYQEEKNNGAAAACFENAAKQGHVDATFEMGLIYWNENNKSKKCGFDYFKTASEEGNNGATFFLGKCYYYGKGVDQNYAEAAKYFKIAAEKGHGAANKMLGFCYYYGNGVPENKSLAAKYIREGHKINGPEDGLPKNCIYVYVGKESAIYNVALGKMMIPLSEQIKYFTDEKEFMVFNKETISYYNASGTKLNVSPKFVVNKYYWNQGVNFNISYDHPTKRSYTVEVMFYNSNGTPFRYRGNTYLISNPKFTPSDIKGSFSYSGGNWMDAREFRKNVTYLLKLGIVDQNDKNVPVINKHKPIKIHF